VKKLKGGWFTPLPQYEGYDWSLIDLQLQEESDEPERMERMAREKYEREKTDVLENRSNNSEGCPHSDDTSTEAAASVI